MVWHAAENSLLDLAFALLLVVVVVSSLGRLRASYWLLLALSALMVSCSGKLMSVPRYELSMFPLFIAFALAGRRAWFDRAYTALAPPLAGGLMAAFALGLWVA